MSMSWIVLVLVLAGGYAWYVSLISKRNKAQEALSGIDVHLKQRLDLIPNILHIAKKFMEHERALLTEITELRAEVAKSYNKQDAGAVQNHLKAAEQLSGKMGSLMVAVENYPDLKSDQTMVQAMQTYNEVEAQISASRRFYNAATTSLNTAVQIFPGNIIAKIAGVGTMPFFEAEEQARAPISASDILK